MSREGAHDLLLPGRGSGDGAGGGIMSGRTCVVTGAASGIGRATALGLARLGARVVIVDRDGRAGERERAYITKACGGARVDLAVADLSSQREVRSLALGLRRAYGRLHVLVNNAGVLLSQRAMTEDGVEATLAVNHLAPFLLTVLLLDSLEAAGSARVVNVGCEGHRRAAIDFDDLMLERRYSATRAYFRSKLAILLFTYQLARRLEGKGVTANCFYPGIVATGLYGTGPPVYRMLVGFLWPLVMSPERAARAAIHLASSPELEGVSGGYFVKKKRAKSSKASYDEALARRLWEVSAELTGI